MRRVFVWSGKECLGDVSTLSAIFVFTARSSVSAWWTASLWPFSSLTPARSSLSWSCTEGKMPPFICSRSPRNFSRLVIAQKYKLRRREDTNSRAVKYKKNKTDHLSSLDKGTSTHSERKSFIMKHLSVSALRLKL